MNERLPDRQEEAASSDQKLVNTDLFFWLQAAVAALVSLILIFTFLGRLISVVGSSMVPTLHSGDLMLVQCLGYTDPKPGDVVVLAKEFDASNAPIVKRVVAVGGQTVDIDYATSTVYVDGKALDEPYIKEYMRTPAYTNLTHAEVPEGSVFVMGDNRNGSADSRDVTLGTVDNRYIIGRAVWRVLPFRSFGRIG